MTATTDADRGHAARHSPGRAPTGLARSARRSTSSGPSASARPAPSRLRTVAASTERNSTIRVCSATPHGEDDGPLLRKRPSSPACCHRSRPPHGRASRRPCRHRDVGDAERTRATRSAAPRAAASRREQAQVVGVWFSSRPLAAGEAPRRRGRCPGTAGGRRSTGSPRSRRPTSAGSSANGESPARSRTAATTHSRIHGCARTPAPETCTPPRSDVAANFSGTAAIGSRAQARDQLRAEPGFQAAKESFQSP